jgi:pyruvate carboxylase subunit B
VERAGQRLEVEATESGVRIAETELNAHIESVPGSQRRHLRIGERGVALAAQRAGDDWIVRIGGRLLRLTVEDERTHLIRELAPAHGQGAVDEVRAPMAGLILRVEVAEGQHVEAGAGLVVVEAMKMENELRAEAGGIVERIAVEEGQAVNPGDLLITFAGDDR